MKEIKLKMSEEIFSEIQNDICVKHMCGSLYGTIDSFAYKIIKAIKEGQDECVLIMKKEKKKGKKK